MAPREITATDSLEEPGWKNARIVKGDLADEVRRMKEGNGGPTLIMGSGSIVSQNATVERGFGAVKTARAPIG